MHVQTEGRNMSGISTDSPLQNEVFPIKEQELSPLHLSVIWSNM